MTSSPCQMDTMAPGAPIPTAVDMPDGMPWTWTGSGWQPRGWNVEAEKAVSALAGTPALDLDAAAAALASCGQDPRHLEAALQWVRWIGRPGTRMPVPFELLPEVESFIVARPGLLHRAVSATHCPPALLRAGLADGDPTLRRLALAHDLLTYEDRCEHLDLDTEEGLIDLARGATTPGWRLAELAAAHLPFPVQAAAMANKSCPAEAVDEALPRLSGAQQEVIARSTPRLFDLVLRTCTNADVICSALQDRTGWSLDNDTARRLVAMDDPVIDGTISGHRVYFLRDLATTLADRALAYLDGTRTSDREPARHLVQTVIGHRLWRTQAQEDALFDHLLSEDGCADQAMLTRGSVRDLGARNAVRILPRITDPVLRYVLVSTCPELTPELVELAKPDRLLVGALMHHDRSNSDLALSLIRLHPARAASVVQACHPCIRPRLRRAASLPRPAVLPVDASRSLRLGRYEYDPMGPGWKIARSGRAAKPGPILGQLRRAPVGLHLELAYDGLRLAAGTGALADPERTRRLLGDIRLFQKCVIEQTAHLAEDAADRYFQAISDLSRSVEAADILHRTREALTPLGEPPFEDDDSLIRDVDAALARLQQPWDPLPLVA